MSHAGEGGAGRIKGLPRWRPRPGSDRTWVWWLPLWLMALDVMVDLVLVQNREPLSFLLVGAPPLAAATRSPRHTAAIAVVCLGMEMWLASRRPGHFGEQHHLALYIATVLIGIASVALSRQRIRAEASLVHARSVAEAMQMTLLRPFPEQLGRLRTAGFYQAGRAARWSVVTSTNCARPRSVSGSSSGTYAGRGWMRFRRSPLSWEASGYPPTSGGT